MLDRLVLVAGLLLAPAAFAAPAADELERLKAGELITRPYSVEGMAGVEAIFWVNAPSESAYRVLCDSARLAEFMPNLSECTILESGEGFVVVRMLAEQGEMIQRRRYDPPNRISWKLIRAAGLRDVEGRWLIRPSSGGTVLSYAVAIQPTLPIPSVLIQAFQNRSLPALAHNVRARIESGGKWIKPDYRRK